MFMRTADKEQVEVQPGLIRSILGHAERLMLCEVSLEQGTIVAAHAHPHEQISYVVRGTVEFTLGDEAVVLTAGESCLARSGVAHAACALTDCVLIDAFSPPRQDFVAGD